MSTYSTPSSRTQFIKHARQLAPCGVMLMFLAAACGPGTVAPHSCTDGVCDLAKQTSGTSLVELRGTWEFYWNSFLSPADILPSRAPSASIDIPGYWTSPYQKSSGFPAHGYGTFRLDIRNADPKLQYGIYIKEVVTAYGAWVNGKYLGGAGQAGSSAETSRGNLGNRLFLLDKNPDGHYLVLIHLSNFDFARGGIGIAPVFGPADAVIAMVSRQDSMYWAIMGIMLVVALIFIIFGLMRNREGLTLYFGLFSLSLTLRMLLQATRIFHDLIPGIGLNWLFSLEILSSVLLAGFFMAYFKASFGIQKSLPMRIINGGIASFGLICCTGIPVIIEPLILYYDLLILLSGFYVIAKLIQFLKERRPRSATLLASFSFLVAATANDVLYYLQVINTGNFIHIGFIGFLIPQAIALSHDIARSFNREASDRSRLSSELDEAARLQEWLESMVADRTRELNIAKESAESANRAKTIFLANMSHEMRTPLNVIIGNSEILQESADPSEIRMRSRIIVNQSEHLSRMIETILDISRIETGKLQLKPDWFNPHTLLERLRSGLGDQARRQGLDFSITGLKSLPEFLWGDAVRLEQILNNLVQNALKFTPTGGISVSCALLESSAGGGILELTVSDTGIGMEPEDQKAVFQLFSQGTEGTKKMYAGTGLGTFITRQLVETMGGTINLQSAPGKGTTFHVRLPLHPAETVLDAAHTRPDQGELQSPELPMKGRYCILVVEDFEPNRNIVLAHLSRAGYATAIAGNGTEALAVLARQRVDLILLDIHMPGMDGFETITEIRKLPTCKTLPVIALTADALVETLDACRTAGMDEVLTKPVRKAKLLETVGNLLERPTLAEDSATLALSLSNKPQQGEIWLAQDFLEIMDHDQVVAGGILQGFLDDAAHLLDTIDRNLQEGDLQSLHRSAHSIKGGALNIQAPELAAKALAVESAAKKQDLGGLRSSVPALRVAFEALEAQVRTLWNPGHGGDQGIDQHT